MRFRRNNLGFATALAADQRPSHEKDRDPDETPTEKVANYAHIYIRGYTHTQNKKKHKPKRQKLNVKEMSKLKCKKEAEGEKEKEIGGRGEGGRRDLVCRVVDLMSRAVPPDMGDRGAY